ncbi:MAG: hypothetical protein Q3M30_15365 [Candidatus Electrothrix sp. Rat3]|nr:hypothetical protein [Candidatus Electrothrix rattekaaiensis]
MFVCIVEQHDIVDPSGVRTGEQELLATHAIDLETNNILSLPRISLSQLNAVYSASLGSWVIK